MTNPNKISIEKEMQTKFNALLSQDLEVFDTKGHTLMFFGEDYYVALNTDTSLKFTAPYEDDTFYYTFTTSYVDRDIAKPTLMFLCDHLEEDLRSGGFLDVEYQIPEVALYRMRMHDTFLQKSPYLGMTLLITRVPGGWIYQYVSEEDESGEVVLAQSSFVPYNTEFKPQSR